MHNSHSVAYLPILGTAAAITFAFPAHSLSAPLSQSTSPSRMQPGRKLNKATILSPRGGWPESRAEIQMSDTTSYARMASIHRAWNGQNTSQRENVRFGMIHNKITQELNRLSTRARHIEWAEAHRLAGLIIINRVGRGCCAANRGRTFVDWPEDLEWLSCCWSDPLWVCKQTTRWPGSLIWLVFG